MPPTEHTHDDPRSPDASWLPNATCDDCDPKIRLQRLAAQPRKGPGWIIRPLVNENRSGWSAREQRDEIYEAARRDGRDIRHTTGSGLRT